MHCLQNMFSRKGKRIFVLRTKELSGVIQEEYQSLVEIFDECPSGQRMLFTVYEDVQPLIVQISLVNDEWT